MSVFLFVDNELMGPVREMVPDQQGSGYNLTVNMEPFTPVRIPNGEVKEASLRPASETDKKLVAFERPQVHLLPTKTAPLIVKVTSSTRLSIYDIDALHHG